MPYVSEEIFSMLPFKEEDSIMISNYPEYNKNFDFETIELDEMLEFVKIFRTFKLENKVGKDFYVKNNTDENYTIIDNLLRLSKNREENSEYNSSYEVVFKKYSMTLYYNKDTESEANVLEKRIEELESSIMRREKLLSNENYVSKAPKEIVESERKKLKEEKEELDNLKK